WAPTGSRARAEPSVARGPGPFPGPTAPPAGHAPRGGPAGGALRSVVLGGAGVGGRRRHADAVGGAALVGAVVRAVGVVRVVARGGGAPAREALRLLAEPGVGGVARLQLRRARVGRDGVLVVAALERHAAEPRL